MLNFLKLYLNHCAYIFLDTFSVSILFAYKKSLTLLAFIPKFIASRTTIKTILDQRIKLKYFTKIIPVADKRKKIYEPAISTKKFIVNWIRRNNEIFKLSI